MNPGAAFVGRVEHPTVTFIAVAERTSDIWFAALVGVVGALPFALAIVLVSQVIHAVAAR